MRINKDELKFLRSVKKWSLQKLGFYYGVSRQYIHQILGKDGIKVKRLLTSSIRKNIQKSIAKENTDKTSKELAHELGITESLAKRLWDGTRHKQSGETNIKGEKGEEYVHKKLLDLGIGNKLTNSHPYDIILWNGKTVEVKSRHYGQQTKNGFLFFHLQNKTKADFYILLSYETKDCFIVPGHLIENRKWVAFQFPETGDYRGRRSKIRWQKFHNRFDLLKTE